MKQSPSPLGLKWKLIISYLLSAKSSSSHIRFRSMDLQTAVKVEPLEQIIDMMQEFLKNSHIERLKGHLLNRIQHAFCRFDNQS